MFVSLKHFKLIFVNYTGFGFILLNVVIQFSPNHLLKRLFFFHGEFLAPLSSTSWPYMWRLICGLSFCSIDLSIFFFFFFLPVLNCFDFYSFGVYFEISTCNVLALFFFLRMASAILVLLYTFTNCRIVFFSVSLKTGIGILITILSINCFW